MMFSQNQKLFVLFLTAFCLTAAIFLHVSPAKAQLAPGERVSGAVDPLFWELRHNNPDRFRWAADFSPVVKSVAESRNAAGGSGQLDSTFSPLIDAFPGSVNSSAVQADGKILLAGFFKKANALETQSLVRLNSDFSVDASFSLRTDGTILSVTLQPDGKILIGGSFTTVNDTRQNRIARLNPDGTLDATFNAGNGADDLVYDVVVQPDGKILLGGSFQGVGSAPRLCVARLNADGSVDTEFTSPIQPAPGFLVPSRVFSLALNSDGKIYLGGFIVPDPIGSPQTTKPLVRLNPNGTLDQSFNPGNINSNLYKVVVQPDGKVLIGGFFNFISNTNISYLARLNADGSLDQTFNPSAAVTSPVYSLHLNSNGKILFGSFILPSAGIVRQLNADGSLDRSFIHGSLVNGTINTIATTGAGKVLAGGTFLSFDGGGPSGALLFNPDGSPDASFSFDTAARGGVRAIARQADGKIIVGGNFNRVNGSPKNRLVRLNPDGALDTGFNTDWMAGAQVNAILIQPDGKILASGINLFSGKSLTRSLVRINPDGSRDTSFLLDEAAQSRVGGAMALQPDRKILFTGSNPLAGFISGRLVRLNPDGALDLGFNSGINLPFEAIAVMPNGQILAAGPFSFTYVNSPTGSETHTGVFRLNPDGAHDRTFRTGLVAEIGRFTGVYALALQPDGQILIGGRIYTGDSPQPAGIVRLNPTGTIDGTFLQNALAGITEFSRVEDLLLLPDGKILAGGFYNNLGSVPQQNLSRLNADGLVDQTFNAGTDATVFDVEAADAGKILIGGDFDRVNGTPRTSAARLFLETANVYKAPFDFDGDGKTDIGIFRAGGSTGAEWWVTRSSNSQTFALQFGDSTDRPVPADFTGDGKTDIALYRASSSEWFVLRSEDFTFYAFPFGTAGDLPVASDFDGDGKADAGVFRPSTATWFVQLSAGGTLIQAFGASGDAPVVADYDGDGKADLAIYRDNAGVSEWWIQRSSNNQVTALQFGVSTDKAVQGDYTGDGRADVAVFRPSTNEWFVMRSEDFSFYAFPFGAAGDILAPGDYDGDGNTDPAVFRPATANWYVQRSTDGILIQQFGASGDRPIPNVFVP